MSAVGRSYRTTQAPIGIRGVPGKALILEVQVHYGPIGRNR
jgi:hypothetical protein